MKNISRTTLRELKKRYLNILKKCFLANLGLILLSIPALADSIATKNDGVIGVVITDINQDGSELLTYLKDQNYHVITDGVFENIVVDENGETLTYIGIPNADGSYTYEQKGGILKNNGDLTFTGGKITFKDGKVFSSTPTNSLGEHPAEGAAIYNEGNITFNNEVDFLENKALSTVWTTASRGIIYNNGMVLFQKKATFNQNKLDSAMLTEGVLYNAKEGIIKFNDVDFIQNKAGDKDYVMDNANGHSLGGNAGIRNSGSIEISGISNFKQNTAIGMSGTVAAISNTGTLKFIGHAIFEENYSEDVRTGNVFGVVSNNGGGILEFTTADFLNNMSISPSTNGGALSVYGQTSKLSFTGLARFIGNQGIGTENARGGGLYVADGKVELADVEFINNISSASLNAHGGALAVRATTGHVTINGISLFQENRAVGKIAYGGAISDFMQGSGVTFKNNVIFTNNIAKGEKAYGGAYYIGNIDHTATFENGFYFEGNKEIEVQTAEDGTVTETERLNDIYMSDGIINIEGTTADAVEYLGGGIRGAEGMGTINKLSVATLVFGEESDSTGFTGVFNQTAGKTVARSETFLGGINNIDGGELETHGNEINYTAIVGGTGRLTHFAMSETPVEIKGLSFKEEGTNLSMTFKNGRYQLKEEMMNAKGNTLSFERADLSILNGSKNLGTIIAKDGVVDVGTNEVNVDSIDLKENSTLQLGVNSLTEHGKVNGVVTGSETSEIALTVGLGVEKGVYQLFDRDNTVNMKENAIFNIKDLENGSYEISKKTSNELSSSLEVGKNEGKTLFAIMEKEGTHTNFQRMQSEVLDALQSQDAGTVAKAKKALNALGARSTSVYQSQATAQFTQMHTVITQMLMNSTAPIFGHAGGEEPARATVYVKGLYDRVNSLAGDGFRMRSKGAVLGVQSTITEDLTVGIGYAGINSVAKEPLRRTEVDTNTGFISAQYQPNNWWVNGVLTYSRSQYDEEKNILSTKGIANYDVDSLGAQITTGYNIKRGNWIVTPEVGVRYLNARQEGYVDSLGTTVEKTTSDFVTTMAGFKVGVDLGWIRPLAGVMVGYDVVTDDISAVNTLANKETYIIKGEALDRLSTTVVAGFAADIADNATLKLEYSGNYRKEYLDHSGMLRLEWRF